MLILANFILLFLKPDGAIFPTLSSWSVTESCMIINDRQGACILSKEILDYL